MENISKNQVLGTVIVVVVLLLGAMWYGYSQSVLVGPSTQDAMNSTTTLEAATSTDTKLKPANTTDVIKSPATSVSGTKSAPTVKPVQPEYQKPVSCPVAMDSATCRNISVLNARVILKLDENPAYTPAWVDLGTVRLQVGDYAGAAEVWNYVTKIQPSSPIGYYNLGELYASYLKDYPKAEANMLLAAQYAPQDTNIYKNLFSLYKDTSYKPTATAAEDIIRKGIVANPKASDLYVVLARYYKSLGRDEDAKTSYEAAIEIAAKAGQSSLVEEIKRESGY